MNSKLIWANLVSDNIDRTRKFYSALGFKSNDNSSSDELTSFSFGQNNFIINFFGKSRLESDFLGEAADTQKQNEIIFSLSAGSRAEVEQWHEKVVNAEGKAISKPYDYDKGYTFVFADPDGHKFNVLYWPDM